MNFTVRDFLGLMYFDFEDRAYFVFIDSESDLRSNPFLFVSEIEESYPHFLDCVLNSWNAALTFDGHVAIELYI